MPTSSVLLYERLEDYHQHAFLFGAHLAANIPDFIISLM